MNFSKQIDNLITFVVACYASCFMNFCSIVFFKSDSYSIGVIITGIMILIYFFRNISAFRKGLNSNFFKIAIFLFACYPILTFLYSPYKDMWEFFRHIFYSMLMLFSAIIVVKNDDDLLGKLCLWALIITAIGGLLSVYAPQYFNEFANNRISRHSGRVLNTYEYTTSWGRAYGFQFQPNAFAIALTLFMFGYIYFFNTKTLITKITTIFCCGFIVILSGSRSGLLIYIGIVTLFLYHSYFKGIYLKNGRIINGTSAIAIFTIVGIICAVAFFILKPILFPNEQIFTSMGAETPFTRIVNFFSSGIKNDGSVASRLSIQADYLIYMLRSGITLFLGYGYSSIYYFVISGKFELIPHNMFVQMFVEYGLLFMIVFTWLFAYGTASLKKILYRQEKLFAFDFIFVLFISGMCGASFCDPEIPLSLGIYIGIISKTSRIQQF